MDDSAGSSIKSIAVLERDTSTAEESIFLSSKAMHTCFGSSDTPKLVHFNAENLMQDLAGEEGNVFIFFPLTFNLTLMYPNSFKLIPLK